jgi:tetratricopeptide (TPR) repeat protein
MGSRTFLRCLFACAVLLVVGVEPAAAQNLVRGNVVDGDGKPVEGATIHFEAVDFVNKRDTKSDRKGEYLFMGLQSGEYKVTASKDGLSETRTFRVGAETAKARLDFTLAAAKTVTTAKTVAAPGSIEAEAAAAKGKELAALQALASTAVAAQQAGQHQSAIASFNELVGKVPTCADCYMNLGASHLELKQYGEAETAFKKSIELRPSVEAYTQLARTYNTQRKFDLAAEATTKAAELAANTPATPTTPATPGADGAPASKTPTAIVGAAPTSETLYNQGVILWNSGKYAEAQKQFEAAVKANPKNPEAQYQLGMANLNLGQIPAARAAFEAYLEAAPSGPKAAEVKTFLTQLPKK